MVRSTGNATDFHTGDMLKALIVDDDFLFRDLLKMSLKKLLPSLEIEEATDAKGAMSAVETFLPDLVLTDISLPGENGLKLTERIKGRYPGTAVVILSGHDAPEYHEAALRSGADRFIPKDALRAEDLKSLLNALFPER